MIWICFECEKDLPCILDNEVKEEIVGSIEKPCQCPFDSASKEANFYRLDIKNWKPERGQWVPNELKRMYEYVVSEGEECVKMESSGYEITIRSKEEEECIQAP